MSSPSPAMLYERTGGGDAYRVAMLEHGYVYPTAPWEREALREKLGKRLQVCGLTHEPKWSEWRHFVSDGDRQYEARWCLVCAHTEAREAAALTPPRSPSPPRRFA